MNTYRISQLAAHTGVPRTTLRYYDTAGLLPASRTDSGYRVYGREAVDRLAFISAAKHLGLPLAEIAELLQVWAAGACADVRADLRPRVAARIADADRRGAELAAFGDRLRQAQAHLDALPDRSGPCDPECGFLTQPAQRPPTAGPPAASAASAASGASGAEVVIRTGERSTVVACSLDGEGLSERTARWRELLEGAGREKIDDGLRLTLLARSAGEVAELAVAEQECCPFYDFRLELDGPTCRLEVRAPAEGAESLAELFG